MEDSSAEIMCLTETHLHSCTSGCEYCVNDSEIAITNYSIVRCDRVNRKGGGCALYISNKYTTKVLDCFSTGAVELASVKVESLDLLLLTIYRPPRASENDFRQVMDKAREVIISQPTPTPNIIISGDFNFPFINWEESDGLIMFKGFCGNIYKEDRTQAYMLIEFMKEHSLSQVFKQKTRQSNMIDLILTNNNNLFLETQVIESSITDHCIIESHLNRESETINLEKRDEQDTFHSRNFNSSLIDWDTINKQISAINWAELMIDLSCEDQLNLLEKKLDPIIKENIPLRQKRHKNRLDRTIRALYRKRRRHLKHIQNCTTDWKKNKLIDSLKRIEETLKDSYEQKDRLEEERVAQSIYENPKFFYTFAKRKMKCKGTVGPLKDSSGIYTKDPQEMSELLNKQFTSVFTKPKESYKLHNPESFFRQNENLENAEAMTDIEFTIDDVIKAVEQLKENSASGPDGWSATFMKKCKIALAVPLSIIWRQSLDTGEIPKVLKTANITPLYKGGAKNDPKNYRPVALTSHIIKCFERILREKITEFLERNCLYNVNQHGFRSGRSCLSQLLDHQQSIIEALCQDKSIDVVYTDFAKAFDKCDHGVLAHKLKTTGITGKVGLWIYNFLANRTQTVVVQGAKSKISRVTSSVPQGTVLAPLLFNILISDIDKNVKHSTVLSFADDTKITKIIDEEDDVDKLQEDIQQLFKWAEENNMVFNENKFQLLRYGRKYSEQNKYKTSNGKEIAATAKARDLGVIMENSGEFESHWQTKLGVCRRIMGMIWRSFKTRDSKIMVTLWKSLIRPILEYCSVLTSPFQKRQINDIEALQRTFTARIAEMAHLNYWNRLKKLNLYSLERRRERYAIIYVYKILEGLSPNQKVPITTHYHQRKGRFVVVPRLLGRGRASTLRENGFSVRGPKLFNVLPQALRNTQGVSLEVFKGRLDIYLQQIPDEPLVPGYESNSVSRSNSLLDKIPQYQRKTMEGCP